VGELWLEAETDLKATIYLAYGGFFRQAFTVLRAWFEIAVHGVFYSGHYGQRDGRYEQWRRNERNAPAKMREIAESLAARQDKVVEVDRSAILQVIDPVYAFLSRHTHARGLDIYDLQEGRDNVPRYLPKGFNLWYGKVLETFNAICFLYWAFFSKEIASYLKKQKAELERAIELKSLLSDLMPEFGKLMNAVLALV
jgi:hypothetical protein